MADDRQSPLYFHLVPGAALPDLASFAPYRAAVILESAHDPAWRCLVSDALVNSGCLYMCAWGVDCSLWDDSVDEANLEQFDFGEVPDDRYVMTTWHDKESLDEAFEFVKHAAMHPAAILETTVLLHVSEAADEVRIRAIFDGS